ncbi:MAG: DUF2520 domain-containing protein [Gemmatimonadetes bacterium]|nr:MAG: DUF2520 domain-containing protein [Gemmatimonadota bacterium]
MAILWRFTINVGIVGAGRVGCALAVALGRCGYRITGISSRRRASAQICAGCVPGQAPPPVVELSELPVLAETIFLAVPDDQLQAVSQSLQPVLQPHHVLIHLSGVLGAAEVIAHPNALSFHPIKSFSRRKTQTNEFEGIFITLEGTPTALPVGRAIAQRLGANVLYVDSAQKAVYHAALCLASNYLVTLFDLARGLCHTSGLPEDVIPQLLFTLMSGTLENLQRDPVENALTGPIARGDVQTIRKHLDALAATTPDQLPIYKMLGRYTLDIVRRKQQVSLDRLIALTDLLKD